MTKRLLFAGIAVAAILVTLGLRGLGGREKTGFRFVTVERGDLESVISSTGTVQPTTTVEVGTQVSGQISEIYVDFNDRVKAGQLIATIDPTILQQEVEGAQANIDRSQAELDQAARELERIQRLYATQVTTESELNAAEYKYAVAKASYKSAEISLQRARRNLSYSEIRAPIDGVVIDRTVDVGQTVAASLSAPQLFLIAEDLSEMEILASVDESDIGVIQEGQHVRFTVQAYPDTPFDGTVRQIRLQSTVQENVVNYGVVIGVNNTDGRLLPGMTATVEFIVQQASDVLKVANAALRFRPTEEMLAEYRARRQAAREAAGGQAGDARDGARTEQARDGARAERARDGEQTTPPAGGHDGTWAGRAGGDHRPAGGRGDHALLWFVGADGKVDAVPVRTILTDGIETAIEGRNVDEGMQCIAAVTSSAVANTANPFQSQQQPRRHGPGF